MYVYMATIVSALHLERPTLGLMQTHNEHIDLDTLAAYAFDALPPEDIVVVGVHIANCAQCQQEVASFRAIGDSLPYALTPAEPSPDLRDRVLARAKATPQRAGATTPRPTTKPAAPRFRFPWLRRLTPFAVAFALVAGVLFGRYWPETAPSLVNQPGVREVAMSGQGQASGVFAVAASSNRAQLEVVGLPALPAGQVYQLWLLDGDTPISVGTFTVDAQGRGRLEFNGLAWSTDYNTVAITAEDSGGSPAPTSTILLAGGF